jgi:hypothetical protein
MSALKNPFLHTADGVPITNREEILKQVFLYLQYGKDKAKFYKIDEHGSGFYDYPTIAKFAKVLKSAEKFVIWGK